MKRSTPSVKGRRKGWAICLVLAAAGCRHVPQDPPSVGRSSFAFADEPTAPPKNAVVSEGKATRAPNDFREATPIYPLLNPVYPAKALSKKAGLVTVGVRVTVDAAGRVTDVGPSLLVFSTPGPFADDFMTAVRVAVLQWRFLPAEIEQIEWVQPPGMEPYSRVLSTEKTETHFDLAFTFTATGKVLGGADGK